MAKINIVSIRSESYLDVGSVRLSTAVGITQFTPEYLRILMRHGHLRSSLAAAAALGLALTLGACSGGSSDSTSGTSASASSSGQSQSGPVEVSPFDAVSVADGLSVEITVDPAAEQSVELEVPSNYSGKVSVTVKDTTLDVSQAGSGVIVGRAVVKATVPKLISVSAQDGSQVSGTGEVDNVEVSAEDGSQLQLGDLKAKNVNIALADGSQATVYASESITGSAKDGSQLTILGSPTSQNISADGGTVTSK